MSIVITGSNGYLGSALLEHLTGTGRQVSGCAKGADYRLCDYKDASAIIHLAGIRSPNECNRSPSLAWAVNVTGFENLLNRLQPDQTLIYASSSIVYHGCQQAVEGTSDFHPTGIYDVTKFTQDQLALLACEQGKKVIGLRLGSVNGPSPSPNQTQLINWMVNAARTTGEITVCNPSAVRPVLGMQDFKRAVDAILDVRPPPGLYNVASFNEAFGGIGKQVARVMGCKYQIGESTPCISFKADSAKLRRACRFEFSDSVVSICESLAQLSHSHTNANRASPISSHEPP